DDIHQISTITDNPNPANLDDAAADDYLARLAYAADRAAAAAANYAADNAADNTKWEWS
ncbi:unnamed protein product, partial [Rotaria sordida]